MIDPTSQIEWEFKQDPQTYAIVYLTTPTDRRLALLPAILLGERPTVLSQEGVKYNVIAFTYRESVIKHIHTVTEAEALFRDMVSLNVANMFFAYVNNIFVDSEMRASLGASENLASQGMIQEFVDFLAFIANEIYKSGTEEMFLLEELKIFVGSLLQAANAYAIVYPVMNYTTQAVKRFKELYYQQSDKQPLIEVFSDDTLSFIDNLNF